MKRRTFLTSTGAAGIVPALAGCAFTSSTETQTSTRTPAKPAGDTSKEVGTEAATPTTAEETESDSDSTPTAQREEIEEALNTARNELTAAFETIHAMDLYRDDQLIAEAKKFEQYDPEKAQSHVATARDAIQFLDRHAEPGDKFELRVSLLEGIALIADEGSKVYDNFRKSFREIWQFEFRAERGIYQEAFEDIQEARSFLQEVPKHRREVVVGLRSVDDSSLANQVRGFDLERWTRIEAWIRQTMKELTPTVDGFKAYTEGLVQEAPGFQALDNGKPSKAFEIFEQAIDAIEASNSKLITAKQRNAVFFRMRIDAYFCRIPLLKEAYSYFLRAAEALAEGEKEKADDLREQGLTKIGDTVDECPDTGGAPEF